MLNYLWAFMMLVGILWAALHGNLAQVTTGALDSAFLQIITGQVSKSLKHITDRFPMHQVL